MTPRILRGLSFLADFLEYPQDFFDLEETNIRLPRETQTDMRHVIAWIHALEQQHCGDS